MATKSVGALQVLREQLPQWWADPNTADLREGLSYVVPTDAVDLGMMMLPGGKFARKVGAGLIAGGATTEAEAGLAGAGRSAVKEFLSRFLKTDEPVDLARRKVLGVPERALAQPATGVAPSNAVVPVASELSRLARAPVSRRQVLKAAGSQAVRAALPEFASPLEQIAKQVAPREAAPLYSLTPEVKTGALNLMARVGKMNSPPLGVERAALIQSVLPESLSLKQFLRQVKTEPEVYDTLMKDLERMAAQDRYTLGANVSKDEYLQSLPESVKAREAKMWDSFGGGLKEPKSYLPENIKPRLFDKDLGNPDWFDALHPSVRDELAQELQGLPYKQSQDLLKSFKKEFAPQLKAQAKERDDYFLSLAKEKTGLENPLTFYAMFSSGADWNKPTALQRLAYISGNSKKVASLDDVNRFFKSSEYEPLSQLEYDLARDEFRNMLEQAVYDPSYEKIYRDFNLEVPQYTPSEKTQLKFRSELDQGYAAGGLVNAYDAATIDRRADELLAELQLQ